MKLHKLILIVSLVLLAGVVWAQPVSDADMSARLRVYARQCDEDLGAKRGALALMEAERDKLQAELAKLKAEKKPEEKK